MVIAQLTIAGFLGLKKAVVAAPLMVPVLLGTILFIVYLKESIFSAGTFLAASTCGDEDDENQVREVDYNEFTNQYKSPSLMSRFADVDWDAGKRSVSNSMHHVALEDGRVGGGVQSVGNNLDDNSKAGSGDASQLNGNLGRRELLARIWSLR